jgi:putative transposase
MQVTRGYKTELDLNNEQRTACLRHAGVARFAYNWGLARRKAHYQTTGKGLNAIALHKELNALKQSEFPWMYEVSKCAAQEALRDLDSAYQHFFRRWKLKQDGQYKGKLGFPRYKSKKRSIGGFTLTGSILVTEETIQLPRLGVLRLKEHEYLPQHAHILSATVSERAGRWFVSLQVKEEAPNPEPATGAILGVDVGLKTLATCSDGTVIANPKAYRSHLKRLRRSARRHSRRQKGSKNRLKAKRQLARQHARIANIRNDALHKATSLLVAKTKPQDQRPAVIVLEHLHVKGMLKNHRLAQSLADASFYEFRRQLTYKALQAGCAVVLADRFYPSTLLCSGCGHKKEEMPLSERIYRCDACGLILDRDLNAALNLVTWARLNLSLPGVPRNVTPAEPMSDSRKGAIGDETGTEH